uniref:Uncharacterized protein n=1 Tax=Anguilla anguilla TaxID=7936 RepID=A0A0E9RLT0_ANGAN
MWRNRPCRLFDLAKLSNRLKTHAD